MALHVLAIGQAGARMAEALLYAVCAGVTPPRPMQISVLCAPQEAYDQINAVWQDLQTVRRHTEKWETGCFSRPVTLQAWPDEQTAYSLNEQTQTEDDRLLCRALFTREQASLSPSRAMDAGYDVAAMSWAAMLSSEVSGALKALHDDLLGDPDTPVVILGSLCETVCAAGVSALCSWLSRMTDRKPAASLLTPVYPGEETDLCAAMLTDGALEEQLRGLCLTGFPEDCRTAASGEAQLADWLAVHAACRQLEGLEGGRAWRIRTDGLAWDMFGAEEGAWKRGYEQLTQLAYLLGAEYGDQLLAAMDSPNRLRDRMTPWYNAHFSAVRKMTDEERLTLKADLNALLRLLEGYLGWIDRVQKNLPAMMRWVDALRDARTAAEEHYQTVLEAAGQYAWLDWEIDRSGMAEERVVHRHDMKDTEAEAAMKRLDRLKEKIYELSDEQDTLNHTLGGRLTRSMLNAIAEQSAAEADDLRAQAEEAERRILHAAQIASMEDMPKVETARSRLERMQHHVQLLDGRTRQARKDAKRWAADSLRHLPPVLEGDPTGHCGLFSDKWLEVLRAWFDLEGRDAAKLQDQLTDLWPWTMLPLKQLGERVARNEYPDPGETCLGGFLHCVLRSLKCDEEAV